MKKETKPIGVIIFGWLNLLIGLWGIIATIITKMQFIAITAPLELLVGVGLLKYKKWARILVVVLAYARILSKIVMSLLGILYKWISFDEILAYFNKADLVGYIIAGIAIYYFTRPKIKEQFKNLIK